MYNVFLAGQRPSLKERCHIVENEIGRGRGPRVEVRGSARGCFQTASAVLAV